MAKGRAPKKTVAIEIAPAPVKPIIAYPIGSIYGTKTDNILASATMRNTYNADLRKGAKELPVWAENGAISTVVQQYQLFKTVEQDGFYYLVY